MKIYTTEKDYFDDLKFWSNAAGDLFRPDSDVQIGEDELPKELQIAWDYWDENHGIYMYLVQYKGEFGLALTKEYYEYKPRLTSWVIRGKAGASLMSVCTGPASGASRGQAHCQARN